MNLPKDEPAKSICIIIYVFFAAVSFYVFFKYLLSAVLPFILSFLLAHALRPCYELLRLRTKLSRRICAGVLVAVCGAFVTALVAIVIQNLYSEAVILAESISAGSVMDISSVTGVFADVAQNPIIKAVSEWAKSSGINVLSSVSGFFAQKLPQIAEQTIKGVPSFLFSCIVFLFSGAYFLSDRQEIRSFFSDHMSKKAFKGFGVLKHRGVQVSTRLLKGYFIITVLTFCQLLIGFFIIKAEYAFIIALITAVLDALPFIGTGVVLVPWAIFAISSGDAKTGAVLLVLFAIITVVRQIAEPAILGREQGIHPLASMLAIYIGYSLFGFKGMIIAPAVAAIVKNTVFDEKIQKNT